MKTQSVYSGTKQPAIASRVGKTKCNTHGKANRPSRQMHLLINPRMQQIQAKWKEAWGATHAKTQTKETQSGKDNRNTAHLIQTVKTNKNIQTLEYIQKHNPPPNLHHITDKELRRLTDILLLIRIDSEENKTESKKKKNDNNTHAQHVHT